MLDDNFYIQLKDATDIRLVGGKALYIKHLLNAGLPAVDGGVLTTSFLKHYLHLAGCNEHVLKAALSKDPSAIDAVRQAIAESVWTDVDIQILKEIFDGFNNLPIVVRSSAVNEDGQEASFAGIFESIINVRTFGEFLQAVRDCWSSNFSKSAIQYTDYLNQELGLMAVIIQPLINSISAGVAALDDDLLVVSASYGLGIGVVDGKVPCDTYTWKGNLHSPDLKIRDKATCIFANEHPWSYWPDSWTLHSWANNSQISIRILKSDERHATLHCEIHWLHKIIHEPALDENLRLRLAELIFSIRKNIGMGNWDVEWCVDENLSIYLLQVRPLTKSLNISTASSTSDDAVFIGVPVSSGEGTGFVRNLFSDDDLKQIKDGEIVAINWIPDSVIGVLSRISALVVEDSSILSHCAILAREMGVPCIGGVPPRTLSEGRLYKVNGNSGRIYRLSVEDKTTDVYPVQNIKQISRSEISFISWLLPAFNDSFARPKRRFYWMNVLKNSIRKEDFQMIDVSGIACAYKTYAIDSQATQFLDSLVVDAIQFLHASNKNISANNQEDMALICELVQ